VRFEINLAKAQRFFHNDLKACCHPDKGRITQEIPQTESSVFVEFRM
jgi:hypothetical protein